MWGKMAKNDAHEQVENTLNRRGFLGVTAKGALVGSGLLAGGWPKAAGAVEAPPVDTSPAELPFFDAVLQEGSAGPLPEFQKKATEDYNSFKRGTVQANGLTFSYVEVGEGPLALCIHGYPDSPFTWRYLMPQLAAAGYRAVCYWNRGYFPSDGPPPRVPGDDPDAGEYYVRDLTNDVIAVGEALGGDPEDVLICHDWGALMGWGVGSQRPDLFRRIVIANVPPLVVFGPMLFDYGQLNRSFYFWYLQMEYSNEDYSFDDFAFPAQLTEDWSPGYDGAEDAFHHRLCYDEGRRQDHVLGSYRNLFSPQNFTRPKFLADQGEVWGRPVPIPVLYLHGTNDGCITLPDRYKELMPPFMPNPASRIEMVQGTGHYLMVQRPQYVNKLILDFLAERP
jgi:pimeloyl-ACP methyl ester carboxylesterase